jgi:hypothetical protein
LLYDPVISGCTPQPHGQKKRHRVLEEGNGLVKWMGSRVAYGRRGFIKSFSFRWLLIFFQKMEATNKSTAIPLASGFNHDGFNNHRKMLSKVVEIILAVFTTAVGHGSFAVALYECYRNRRHAAAPQPLSPWSAPPISLGLHLRECATFHAVACRACRLSRTRAARANSG